MKAYLVICNVYKTEENSLSYSLHLSLAEQFCPLSNALLVKLIFYFYFFLITGVLITR